MSFIYRQIYWPSTITQKCLLSNFRKIYDFYVSLLTTPQCRKSPLFGICSLPIDSPRTKNIDRLVVVRKCRTSLIHRSTKSDDVMLFVKHQTNFLMKHSDRFVRFRKCYFYLQVAVSNQVCKQIETFLFKDTSRSNDRIRNDPFNHFVLQFEPFVD